MLEQRNKRPRAHLINLIGKRSNATPNFVLLIGAGASVSSGVKLASQMITEWQQQMYVHARSTKPFGLWLKEQDWIDDEEKYSILFEKVYDQRSQRRIYIEECVKDAKPSWGYIYLANTIARAYFNAVFTPNFDDLLNEACFLYADCRPLVCAHDSAVTDIRLTSARPKIIKLHGDFLYDSIKNTVRETETLENNMRDKFMQFAREYGLVVIGYGGNDRSIMDILDRLLMSQGYFPNGLYWCIRKGDTVSKKVVRLLRRERTYWVEIEGFDEFMAELHKGLGLTLPDAVRDPYKATTERLNRFIEARKEIRHRIIENDCAQMEKQVKKFEQVISGELPPSEFDRLVPYAFLGDTAAERKNYEDALNYYKRALIQNPDDIHVIQAILLIYLRKENLEEALRFSERLIVLAPTSYLSHTFKGLTLYYLKQFKEAILCFDEALRNSTTISEKEISLVNRSGAFLADGAWEKTLSDTERVLNMTFSEHAIVNKCTAMKKLSKESEAKKIIQDALPKLKNPRSRAGAFALLGDKKNMLRELEAAIKENREYRIGATFDAEFMDYREDSDFVKLLNKYKPKDREPKK